MSILTDLSRALSGKNSGKGRRRQSPHYHYMITCGNMNCQSEFQICGAAGLPCFVHCPFCSTANILWGGDK